MASKLIIVEGLTGSGKSVMAHFIARQLRYHSIGAEWVHEAEDPHPILEEIGTDTTAFMKAMAGRWRRFATQVGMGDTVTIVEAAFFNNLIESLLAHKVDRREILRYAEELQGIIEPLDPMLIYLWQPDIERALQRTFKLRGEGFEKFVIAYTTGTPLAKRKEWTGYDGMVSFWREFVALTDALYQRFRINKVKIDNSAGNWEDCSRHVMGSLGLPHLPEPRVTPSTALGLAGVYRDRQSGRRYEVAYENGDLSVDLFAPVRSKLVPRIGKDFAAEGWHFLIRFEREATSGTMLMTIDGRDVDYLRLAGSIAEKIAP